MKKIENIDGHYIPVSREAHAKLLEMEYHVNVHHTKYFLVRGNVVINFDSISTGHDIAYLHSDGFFYDEPETERKQMTLQDLENGMIIEHADGTIGIWLSGTSISHVGGISSNMLENDLSSNAVWSDYAIVKVYSAPTTKENYNADFDCWFRDRNILYYCTLLWEREEPIEMTMEAALEELAKLKGKKVTIV